MSAPSTQKAVLVTKVGSPVELSTDHPVPTPSEGQVLVKVSIAGINPHDQRGRDWGLFTQDKLPAVVAADIVGTVVALGSKTPKYQIGDKIVWQADFSDPKTQYHGLQEYALAREAFSIKIPEGTSDDEAASLPTNIIAPLVALFDASTLNIPAPWTEEAKSFDYKSTSLLVVGAGSSCGKFGIQLAKLAGIGKIVAVGGKEEESKSYGATHFIDRHGGEDIVLQRIQAVVGDDLIYAYDAVNPPETQTLALKALSSHTKGKLARLVPTGPVDETKVTGKTAGFEVKDTFGSSQAKQEIATPFWENLPGYLKSGDIKPLPFVTQQGLDADKVNELFDRLRDGKSVIKTHFHF